MSAHTQIETAQAITRQTVATALENHGLWAIPFHDVLDDGLENALVGNVVDTITEGEVDRVVLALSNADVAKLTGTGEVLAVLVERNSHDTVSCVEGFFNTIAVVNINVNIENSLLEAEKL